MAFRYRHSVPFRDTDAAGVVFFSNVFCFFHEAYEASLAAMGIDVQRFFQPVDFVAPIIHADCDFFRPMQCGEWYDIVLTPKQEGASEFSITYQSFRVDEAIAPRPFSQIISPNLAQEEALEFAQKKGSAKGWTRHVVIDPEQRQRVELPPAIQTWIEQWSD